MDPFSPFVRHVGNKLWLLYKGELDVLRYARHFSQFLRCSRDVLDDARLKSLQELLEHSYSTSPYYNREFLRIGLRPRDFKTLDDLAKLPFLTKKLLNENMDQILSQFFHKTDLEKSSTGGSIGLPLTFYRDRAATMIRRSQDYIFNSFLSVFPGTKRAWVWGSPIDTFSTKRLRARVRNFLTDRGLYFYSFDASEEKIVEFLQKCCRHKPRAVFAYPSMLTLIAQTAIKRGIEVTSIEKIVLTAEPVYDFQRQLLQSAFGASVYERYGSREIGTVAAEVKDLTGMLLFEPSYYFEVVDKSGKSVKEGELGELVVTDFFNYAMPMIRYRTGDLVRLSGLQSTDDIVWQRLLSVGGRIVDLLLREDGSFIAGQAAIMCIRKSGIRSQVQFIQNSPKSFTIKHLLGEAVSEDSRNCLLASLSQVMRTPVSISYKAVDQLTYDGSGKYRYVVSECGSWNMDHYQRGMPDS